MNLLRRFQTYLREKVRRAGLIFGLIAVSALIGASPAKPPDASTHAIAPGSNPLFHDKFTADPAPLVVGDRLYLYVGHDEAQRDEMFNMREWLVYSTADMRTWTAHGPIMRVTDFNGPRRTRGRRR